MAKTQKPLQDDEAPELVEGRKITFHLSDGSTQIIIMRPDSQITPAHLVQNIKSQRGFWVGDPTGVAPGSVFVPWEAIVSVTT